MLYDLKINPNFEGKEKESRNMFKTFKEKIIVYSIILLLGEIGFAATNIYLPSLPSIASNLDASSHLIQFTITIYLFSFGLSQFIYGPLSDFYGRRKIAIVGLIVVILGSIICSIATTVDFLIYGRFLQGIGTGSSTVMARAIMCDLFRGNQLARAGSVYGMIATQLIATMPILGGYIETHLNWRFNFIFILSYSLLTLLLIYYFLPETRTQPEDIQLERPHIRHLIIYYFHLLKDKNFLGCVLCSSYALAGLIAYSAISPFIFLNELHFTPIQFGWLSFVGAISFSLSSLINSYAVIRVGIERMLVYGILLMSVGGGLLLLFSLFHLFSVLSLLSSFFIFISGTNWIFSNAAAKAMTPLAEIAGTAGALFGAIQIIFSSLCTGFIANLRTSNQLSLAIIFLIVSAATFFTYFLLLDSRFFQTFKNRFHWK